MEINVFRYILIALKLVFFYALTDSGERKGSLFFSFKYVSVDTVFDGPFLSTR